MYLKIITFVDCILTCFILRPVNQVHNKLRIVEQQIQIIDKLNNRDRESLKTFFRSFYPSVCVFANKYVHDSDLSEDFAQEAFLSFWLSEYKFADIKALKGFIYTSARNLCLNYIKSKTIRDGINQTLMKSESFFHDLIVEEETYRIIHQAIEQLPPQSQKIITLFINGYKNPEIADELNISINTVKSLKKSAYSKLKELLKDNVYVLFVLNQFFNSF